MAGDVRKEGQEDVQRDDHGGRGKLLQWEGDLRPDADAEREKDLAPETSTMSMSSSSC